MLYQLSYPGTAVSGEEEALITGFMGAGKGQMWEKSQPPKIPYSSSRSATSSGRSVVGTA